MHAALASAAAILLCAGALDAEARERSAFSSSGRKAAGELARSQERALLAAPLAVVTTTGEGQAGYIHFFELTLPDGTLETQVGIELEDQRIAWSIPNVGPSVAAFMSVGELEAGTLKLPIRHLYGIRPLLDDVQLAGLQRELLQRVSTLVDGDVAYCNDPESRDRFCMSCLAFVLQVVYPGPYPLKPRLPAQFPRQEGRLYYTTEDLLLYLSGIGLLPTQEARQRRVEQLALPAALKDDLLELIAAFPAEHAAGIQLASGTPEAQSPAAPPPKAKAGTRRRRL